MASQAFPKVSGTKTYTILEAAEATGVNVLGSALG
jgi:hypothetical protein